MSVKIVICQRCGEVMAIPSDEDEREEECPYCGGELVDDEREEDEEE